MNIMRTITSIFRPPRAESPVEEIERALAGERRRVHTADPDTARRWSLLRSAIHERQVPARTVRPLIFRPAFAIGLAVASVAIAAAVVWLPHNGTTSYATARGRQSTIILADSSEVVLNHTTKLLVHSVTARGGRSVSLDGEAFFRVKKTGHPFVVTTPVGSVEVLGTAFNVRVRDGVLNLTVVEGRVRLGDDRGSIVVDAGRTALCSAGSIPALSDRPAGQDAPGWMYGRYGFESASVASVCREFEETFDVHITLQNPGLAASTITGTVEARTADAALATIARLTGTRVSHENGSYTLY